MKLSETEKAAHRAAFRAMSPGKKLEHICTYYRAPILLGLLALVILGSTLHRRLTAKEPLVYLGLVNVAVGEDLAGVLGDGYLLSVGADPARQEVYLYEGLYLSENAATENHEYAYASRMKLMGAVSAGKLDLVLMNREGYDLLSHSAYLAELTPSLFETEAGLYEQLLPRLTENTVVLSDNEIEVQLGEAEERQIESVTAVNALEVSSLPLFAQGGFPAEVYLGVIGNSSRLPAVASYLLYLISAQ